MENWDRYDWLKFVAYVLGGLSLVMSNRSGKFLGTASTIVGLIVDLEEPPKHCGQRTVNKAGIQPPYCCLVCGSLVAKEPKLGFE